MAERPCSTVALQGSPLGARTIAVKSAPPKVIVKRDGVVVASTTAAAAARRSRSGTPPPPLQSGSVEDMRILKVVVAIEAQIKLDPDDPLRGSVSVVAMPRPTIAKEEKKKKKKKAEKPVPKQQGDKKQLEEPAKKPAKISCKTGDQIGTTTITPNRIKNPRIWDAPILPIVSEKALITDRAKYFALNAPALTTSAGGRETLIPPEIVPDRLKQLHDRISLQGKNQRRTPDRRGSEEGSIARIPSRRDPQIEAVRTSFLDRGQGIARAPSTECRRCSQQGVGRISLVGQEQGEQGFTRTPSTDRRRSSQQGALGSAEQGFTRTLSMDRRRSLQQGAVGTAQQGVPRRCSSQQGAVGTPPVNREQEFVRTPPMGRRVSDYHIQKRQGTATTDVSTEAEDTTATSSSSSQGDLTPRNFQSARHELDRSWTEGITRSKNKNWKAFATDRNRGIDANRRTSCIDPSEEDRLQMQRACEERRRRQIPNAGRPPRLHVAPFACQIQEVMEKIYGDLDGPPRRRKSLQKSCCIKPLHSRIEEVMGKLFGEKQQQKQRRSWNVGYQVE